MNEHPIEGMLGTSMEKLRSMIDVNTIIGDTIKVDNGITIIPISKVTYGFGSGGSNFPSKSPVEMFGGGVGGGATVQPVAFLIVNGEDVKILQMDYSSPDAASRAVEAVPDLIDKISGLFSKKKDEKKENPREEK